MGDRPDERGDLIFVGTVLSVGRPPGQWSGPVATYQEVRYRVEDTIRGTVAAHEIGVLHAVVRNGPTAEPGDLPGLSSWLFASGARVVVMAVHDAFGRCVAPSEYFGAMPYSRLLVEQVRAAVRTSGASVAPT